MVRPVRESELNRGGQAAPRLTGVGLLAAVGARRWPVPSTMTVQLNEHHGPNSSIEGRSARRERFEQNSLMVSESPGHVHGHGQLTLEETIAAAVAVARATRTH